MLKLHALDLDDLQVISAHMQDALVRRADMQFLRKKRQFVFAANRFGWEALPQNIRHRTGLHFEHVLSVKHTGFASVGPDSILSLLSIGFAETAKPAGIVMLQFAAGPTLSLEVEYLDAAMKDFGTQWTASTRPQHD